MSIAYPVTIIGIDPGYDRCGIAVIEKDTSKETLLYSGCFTTSRKDSLEERLFSTGQEIERVIKKYAPDVMAIETLFFQKNTKTAMAVAEARGIIMYEALRHQLKIHQFGPGEIKVAVTGYGNASKEDIAHMVPKLITLPENIQRIDDELDAIAVALTYSAQHNYLSTQ